MAEKTTNEPSDAAIALRCQLGDAVAWQTLVERWNPKLRSFVSRMLSEHSTVDDVLQDAWLKIVRSMVRLSDPSKLPAWLYQITRTSVADHLRRQYRVPPTEVVAEIAGDDPMLDQWLASQQIESALQQLHPTDRECVVLHYFDHLSVGEIAVICDIPTGTVKSRLHRSRILMRTYLSPENPEQ